MTRTSTFAAIAALAALIPACNRLELSGPPTIRLGLDECAGCGMLVMEEHCSCALLVSQEGNRSHLLFDDLGCLLDYRADHPQTSIVDTFVHDYTTGKWANGVTASYLSGVSLSTPMGSGMIAFETDATARKQITTTGGTLSGYEQITSLRREWREARRLRRASGP